MNQIFIRGTEIATKEYVNNMSGGNSSDMSKYAKTFVWDGASSEDNPNNITLFTEFYKEFKATNGRVHLMGKRPDSQEDIYVNLDVQSYGVHAGEENLGFIGIPSWSTWENDNDETYYFYQPMGGATFQDENCISVEALSDWEAEISVLSTTAETEEGDYYYPVSDGSPISKGYLNEVLNDAPYDYGFITKETPDILAECLALVDGYDANATQVLKNINGVLTWVSE